MKNLAAYRFIIPLCLAFIVGLFPQSADNPAMMLPPVLISILLILSGKIPSLSLKDPILVLLVIIWGVWTVSGWHSAVPFPSKVTWVLFSTLPVSYIAGKILFYSPPSSAPIPLSWVGFSAIPFAIYTVWQGINGVNRPDAPFDDANLLGIFYAFSVLSLLSPLPIPHRHRYLYAGVIALLLTALLLTQSRSAIIALLLAALYTYRDVLFRKNIWTRKTFLMILGGTAFLIILTWGTGFYHRLSWDGSMTGRLAMWQAAWGMSFLHPLTGFGIGTFHLYYPPFRLPNDDSLGWMAHMDFLQMAVESGWGMPLLLYALFATALFLSTNRAATSLIICFLVAAHFNYPFHVVPFLMIMGMGMALATKTPEENVTPPDKHHLVFSMAILIALLSLVWTAARTGTTLLLQQEVQAAYHLHDQSRFDKAITSCINDGDKDFPDCRLMAARFLTLDRNGNKTQIPLLLDMAQKANPTSPEPDYLRAWNVMTGTPPQPEAALPLLHHSLSLNPAYWPARRLAIEIYLKKGDKPAARKILKDGLDFRYIPPVRDEISRLIKKIGPE